MDEESCRVSKNADSKPWLHIVYKFILSSAVGETWSYTPRRNMFVAMTGGQTMGSAQSYALKQYLRSLLFISTGDETREDFTLGAGTQGQFKTLICPAGAGVCAAKISALGTSMKIGSANGDPTGTALTTLTLGYQEAVLLQFLDSGWSIVGGGIQAAVS